MAIGGGYLLGAAAIGAGGSMLAGRSAGKKAAAALAASTEESRRQFDASMAEMRKAAEYLESIGVPPEEAQRIALQQAQLGPSAMEDIESDPRLRSAQMDALASMQQMGEAGLTDAEKAQQMMTMRSTGSQAQARDKAILQNMAERGMGGSGSELIARLQGSQSAADRASMEQAQLSGQAQNRALNAMMQSGQLGGQIRGQEYAEQGNLASARDRIEQFNEMQRVQAQNQQEMHNKALIQQQFENEMQKRQAVAAARTGSAQAGMQRAGQIMQGGQATAAGHLQQGAAKSQLFGNLAGAGIGAIGSYYKGAATQQPAPQPVQQPTQQTGVMASSGGPHYDDGGVIGTSEYREEEEYAEGGVAGQPEGLDNLTEEEYQSMMCAILGGTNPVKKALGGVVGTSGYRSEQGYAVGGLVEAAAPAPNSNGGFAGGGLPVPDSGMSEEDRYLEGDVVPGDSFAGDRVDAKVNSGEMVLNIEQQQRLMELLRGLRDLEDLGDEDIVEPAGGELPFDPAMLEGGAPSAMDASVAQLQGQPQLPPMAPQGQPQLAQGGMVPSEYKFPDTEAKPRGLHGSLRHEQDEEEKAGSQSKQRKARIKAYETLINGGK